MTMPEKSAYQRVKEERCRWCALGVPKHQYHKWHEPLEDSVWEFPTCTAPTIEEFCEEQAKRIAELEARKISITYGDLYAAHPEVADEIPSHEWDNKNTIEQAEYLLTLIRRRDARIAELEQDKARMMKAFIALRDGIDTPQVHCDPLDKFSSWRYVVDMAIDAAMKDGEKNV